MSTTKIKGNGQRTVPVEYAKCRTLAHAWDYTTAKQEGRFWIQGLRCLRCATERTQKIDGRTGERLGNKYDYPDGYVLAEGGALTQAERAALRITEFKRQSEVPTRRRKAG